MSNLNDPIVINLLVRIIKLVEYFCRQALQNKENKLFKAISSRLNDLGREQGLFNCLAIPDDDLRLMVVRSLFVVPLDDFSADEIEQITKIMSNCNNIGAGKTELVLSTIYWILTKFVLGNPDAPCETDEGNIYKQF